MGLQVTARDTRALVEISSRIVLLAAREVKLLVQAPTDWPLFPEYLSDCRRSELETAPISRKLLCRDRQIRAPGSSSPDHSNPEPGESNPAPAHIGPQNSRISLCDRWNSLGLSQAAYRSICKAFCRSLCLRDPGRANCSLLTELAIRRDGSPCCPWLGAMCIGTIRGFSNQFRWAIMRLFNRTSHNA